MDDMFFTADERSLRRGRRIARRTPTCRPCVVWPTDEPELRFNGVILDVSPYGMLIRMMESLPAGTEIRVQLMRDDAFENPLSAPVDGCVVRHAKSRGAFTDHGVRIELLDIPRPEPKPLRPRPVLRPKPRTRPRMHTIDYTVGDRDSLRRRR